MNSCVIHCCMHVAMHILLFCTLCKTINAHSFSFNGSRVAHHQLGATPPTPPQKGKGKGMKRGSEKGKEKAGV
jgi:hypothetical protein